MFLSILPNILAYLDPGSGSLLLQLLLAALLGLGVFIRSQWGKVKSLFIKNKNVKDSGDNE